VPLREDRHHETVVEGRAQDLVEEDDRRAAASLAVEHLSVRHINEAPSHRILQKADLAVQTAGIWLAQFGQWGLSKRGLWAHPS